MTISRKRDGFFALGIFCKPLILITILIFNYNLHSLCTDENDDLVYPFGILNLSG